MTDFRYSLSPALIFLGFAFVALLSSALTVWIALSPTQIDLPEGAVPQQLGPLAVAANDLIEEPDQLGSYAAIDAFRVRQTELRAVLDAPQVPVTYETSSGAIETATLEPRDRVLSDLPPVFWFQIAVGVVSLLIGGWVLGLRQDDWGARMFALTTLMLPMSTHSAAIYSTRQIALEGDWFFWLSGLNATGAMGFGIGLVGLFAQYPRPLFAARWLWIPAIVFSISILLTWFHLPPDNMIGFAILSEMLISIIFGVIQWVKSRREPLNRAGLRWFILISLSGCSLFVFLSSAPPTLGLTEQGVVSQGYAFGFFTIMHVGLALGVLRYGVFNLDRWSYYIWLWLSGMLMVFVLDVALIRLLQTQPWVSLGVALLLSGFLYFPVRQLLLRLLLQRKQASLAGQMSGIVSTALSPSRAEHDRRWDKVLEDIFSPLAPPHPLDHAVTSPQIAENGLALMIPGVDGLAPRYLRYALKGRRLFAPNDVDVANNLIQMHNLASESRQSYERGVIRERDRISRDIHDNIGAQLLSALHSREVARKDDLLRDSLTDLRAIINDGFQAEYPLDMIVADMRTEAHARLDAHDITLIWDDARAVSNAGTEVRFELANGLRSILREGLSNVVRHAKASQVAVRLARDGDNIEISIEDDGIGVNNAPSGDTGGGHGIPNIVERAAAMGGQGSVGPLDNRAEGTLVRVTLPLETPVRESLG